MELKLEGGWGFRVGAAAPACPSPAWSWGLKENPHQSLRPL